MLILKEVVLFILPIALANIIHHWIVIPLNLFSFISIPIDGNLAINNTPVFGKNKTYRGLVIIAVLTGLFFIIFNYFIKLPLHYSDFWSGCIFGLSYMIFELPNSFIKRRLNLTPGGKNKGIFFLLDELDSIIGAIIALNFIYRLNINLIMLLIIIGGLLHYATNILLRHFGYKNKLSL